MKKLFLISVIFAVNFNFSHLQAQQALTSTGGDVSGTEGSASYSIGQIDYISLTSNTGNEFQGVQQPYEFFILKNEGYENINVDVTVWPNPTISFIKMRIENIDLLDMNLQLYDINGRLILNQPIDNHETLIPIEKLEAATYILKVNNRNKELKVFKIIKNN